MPYEISFDRKRMQIDVIHGFLKESYWSPRIRRDVIEAAIQHSLVAGVFERAGGAQVAFARVVTDYATFAWLCDVFVLPDHRGRGLAKLLMRALLDHPALQTLRRWCLATADAHGLYSEFGFVPADAARWMELRPPATAWKQAQGAEPPN